MAEAVDSSGPTAIPTIRLDSEEADAARLLRAACVDVGFFYLEGHGMDDSEQFRRVLEESRKLFNLPLLEKQALSDKVMSRGYTAMQEETLDPSVQSEGDTKEGFYIGWDIPQSDPRHDPAKLRGPNQWPSKDILPLFQSTMEEYHSKMSAIAFRVVQLLALALGLDSSYFDSFFQDDRSIATLRLLHYDKRQSKPEDGVYACGAHSDYGMITLLLTDEQSGLQIFHDGQWIDVPPRPSAFVVNLGDMLERWTNGLMKSTKHRVLTSGENERYSIPFFYDPAFETVVKCLDVCTGADNPPRFPPTTAGEHLVGKYHETHADFDPEEKLST